METWNAKDIINLHYNNLCSEIVSFLMDALLAEVIQQLALIIKATGANSILIPQQNCSVIAKQSKVYVLHQHAKWQRVK